MSEIRIRGGTEDNSRIIFLIIIFFNENICCDHQLDSYGSGSQNMYL